MRRAAHSLGIALCTLAVWAAGAAADPLAIEGRCSVRVFGTSTLHDFEGVAPCASLAIEPAADGSYRARTEVLVGALDTDNESRNKRMQKMFEAQRHPSIVATFERIDAAALRSGAADALGFRLALHGVERPVAPRVTDFNEVPERSARFRASFELSLREFGLEAPVVMGFIAVGDRVRVEVDVELTAHSAP